jgi:restriction system protein
MPVPDFQTIMLPLLQQFGDGREHSIHEVLENLTQVFSLSGQELNELLPSGKQTAFYNRVGWARTYLTKSGLLEMSRRSFYKITERGCNVLESHPTRIDMKYLEQFPEYIEFREREGTRRRAQNGDQESDDIQPKKFSHS